MPAADPAIIGLAQQHAQAIRLVRARVLEFLARSWQTLGSYRDADADRFVNAVLPVVLGGQRQVASLTDGYLAALARATLGEGRPVGVPAAAVTGTALRGVEPAKVYRRPFETVWRHLGEQRTPEFAIAEGARRLDLIGATDLQLARTHAARYIFGSDTRVVGYRRVVEGGNPCALCEIAATERYSTDDLMPIHPGCNCGVEAIYGTRDPGQVIDPEGLAGLQESLAERGLDTSSLRHASRTDDVQTLTRTHLRDEVAVQTHGELGPVLTVAGHDFKGPDDI